VPDSEALAVAESRILLSNNRRHFLNSIDTGLAATGPADTKTRLSVAWVPCQCVAMLRQKGWDVSRPLDVTGTYQDQSGNGPPAPLRPNLCVADDALGIQRPQGITPTPIPALFSSSLGDRSGRQSESHHSLQKGYMKRCFDYISARLRFDQNAYSRPLLPACTSSPA
jgi:hypothetical protein